MRFSTGLSCFSIAAMVTLFPFVGTSCADDPKVAPTPSRTAGEYSGLMSTPGETAVVSLTVASDLRASSLRPLTNDPPAVSGSLTFVGKGGRVTLTGSFDPANGHLVLSATTPRGTYTLEGTSDTNGFSGTATSPSGSGTFSLAAGPTGSVLLYCGTYAGDASGAWNIIVGSNDAATGAHCDESGCGVLLGKRQGATLTLGDPKALDLDASGTFSGDGIDGTWSAGGKHGSWHGSQTACQSTVEPAPADAGADAASEADASPPPTRETVASGLNDVVDLSVDDAHAYWLSGTDATVKRCPLAGCGGAQPELLVSGLSVPTSVAVAAGSAFWTSGFRYVVSCSVASLPCNGATFADLGDAAYPAHLWVANGRLYWLREQGAVRSIETCPLAGCTNGYPHSVYASKSGSLIHDQPLAGLAVTATHIYVSSFGGGITRLSLVDAENADNASAVKVTSSGFGTGNVDSDGASVRWPVQGEGKVYTCAAPDCATVSDLLTGQEEPGGTRSTTTHIYGFNRGTLNGSGHVAGTSIVWRLAK